MDSDTAITITTGGGLVMTIILCDRCTRILEPGKPCLACNGMDYEAEMPSEIDDTWHRDVWPNGVVFYGKDVDGGRQVWICDLNETWHRRFWAKPLEGE